MRPLGDQSAIVYRPQDPDRVYADSALRPPSWTRDTDTLWFQLTVPSARIPGESRHVGLSACNAVPTGRVPRARRGDATPVGADAGQRRRFPPRVLPGAAVRPHRDRQDRGAPRGEVVDFVQYDGNIPLPTEAPQDEWASMSVVLTVQFDGSEAKRIRVA